VGIRLVDPRGAVVVATAALAPRHPVPPGGVELGFLVNEATRHQGPDFFGYTVALEDALRARFPVAAVHRACKPLLSRPAGDDLLATYRSCSGVVNGLAK
jgi:hypothetical protein